MLVAVLNTCSKEELEDEHIPEPQHEDIIRERRGVIKNKILAVGRMARVFALLRCAGPSSRHSQISRDRIQGGIGKRLGAQEYIDYWQAPLWDAGTRCGRHQESHFEFRRRVRISLFPSPTSRDHLHTHVRRRSDIENERLPPAGEKSATSLGQSKAQALLPTPTPIPTFMPIPMAFRPMTPPDNGRCETPPLERASSPSASSISSPPTPPPFQASSDRRGSLRLGGSTSPSTRQRSVQNAISMLQAALDGKKGGAS